MTIGGAIAWLVIHLFLWAATAVASGDTACSELYCDTAIEGLVDVLGRRPELSISYVVGLIGGLIVGIWSVFSFDYEVLGDGAVGLVLRTCAALASGLWLLSVVGQALRR